MKAQIFDDPILKVLQIKVETFKGEVQLSGFVNSGAASARAVEVTRSVKGVQSVKNTLIVKKSTPIIAEERPLRAELFGSDQMKQHDRILANAHELSDRQLPDKLLSRLSDNEAVLVDVCRPLAEAIVTNRLIVPAEEWLLDNFYLIEEQVRTAKRHLPKGYSLELPRLSKGPSAGRPRVYDIALETISHGDGRVGPEGLISFVAAYQRVTFLKLGELWADQMIKTAAEGPNGLIMVIADMARSNPPMVGSFVAELARRLQGQGPALALPLTCIEQRLAGSGLAIEHLVRIETRQQAADQVSVSNSIGSLRFLSAMDWREFVETMSVVNQHLSEDPADVYGRMDFTTRDAIGMADLVVVPTLLTSIHAIDDLMEAMEVRFLANRDRHFHFGLPTDFPDAAAKRPQPFRSI